MSVLIGIMVRIGEIFVVGSKAKVLGCEDVCWPMIARALIEYLRICELNLNLLTHSL